VTRGADEVRRLLRERSCDVRTLDPAGFRGWLGRQLGRWAQDPVFRQRSAVRDLRRGPPELAADAAGAAARLQAADRAVAGARQAVAGLTAAVANAAPGDRDRLAAKRHAYRQRLREWERRRAELVRGSPELSTAAEAAAALDRARRAAGLDRAEAELAALLAARGRRTGRAGAAFEELAADAVAALVLPELGGDVRVLRRVRLGAAGVEFDALLVRPAGDGVAEVLAAVEAKRDPNGLGHGFVRRQADLAWLTGDADRYAPAAYRTRAFPAGHFDRPAEVREGGTVVRLGPGSFGRFRRDAATGWFLDGLYLVTRPRPLWGLGAAAAAKVAAWAATDVRFDPYDPGYLGELHRRCLGLAAPPEAADVLRPYADDQTLGRQVILIDDGPGR
jgi:hypothetical protein